MTQHASGVRADANAFRDFEHAGWQSIPDRYDDAFARLTPQAAGPLLDAAGVARDTRVLDVATGPGYVAAAAAARGARVVAVDFSPAMVARARLRFANDVIAFREADAENLPFEGERFDAVVMNFGLLHLARPERALEEAHRVLRSGGRFAFTVWAPPDAAVGFGIVLRAVAEHGTLAVPLPPGPPFFRFSDPHECARVLRAAGFVDDRTATVAQHWRLHAADELFAIMQGGTVRTAGLLRSQAAAAQAAIRDAMREAVARYRAGDGFVLPMPAVLAAAAKP
jgi:SAM-dependent methyltransferase